MVNQREGIFSEGKWEREEGEQFCEELQQIVVRSSRLGRKSGWLGFRETEQKHVLFLQEYRLFVWMSPYNTFIASKTGHPPFTLFSSLCTILYDIWEQRNFPPIRKKPRCPGNAELSCLSGCIAMSFLVIICQNANIVGFQAPTWSFGLGNVADVHIILSCIYFCW